MTASAGDRTGPRPDLTRPHVLIVTADEDLRDFLQEGLIYGGFWISVIASGVQTIEVFRLRSFDLVLIDHALPGMDAIELVRRLRQPVTGRPGDSPRTDVPIGLIVDAPLPDESVANEAGIDVVLAPPLELETLVPHLHEIVRNWRAAHPDRPWADQAAQLRPG